jgi:hypothetical protein
MSVIGYDGSVEYQNPSPQFSTPAYLWDMVRGNLILPDKPEYAYVPLWSRGQKLDSQNNPQPDASLNLFIFPVRSRAKPAYDPHPMTGNPAAINPACDVAFDYANLDPQLIEFNYFPPPTSGANPNVPFGVFKITAYRHRLGAGMRQPISGNSLPASINPLTEGAYVVVSDNLQGIQPSGSFVYVRAYNGMIFKLGQEVADKNGTPGTSNGQFWAVAEVDNLPSDAPFNMTSVSQIGQTDFVNDNILGLVIGRQPDPADGAQKNVSNRKANEYLNRTGTAQELGFILSSVPLR